MTSLGQPGIISQNRHTSKFTEIFLKNKFIYCLRFVGISKKLVHQIVSQDSTLLGSLLHTSFTYSSKEKKKGITVGVKILLLIWRRPYWQKNWKCLSIFTLLVYLTYWKTFHTMMKPVKMMFLKNLYCTWNLFTQTDLILVVHLLECHNMNPFRNELPIDRKMSLNYEMTTWGLFYFVFTLLYRWQQLMSSSCNKANRLRLAP